MSRRALLLGLLAFVVALVVVLPARWIGGMLPPDVRCGDWRGTLWRGRCRQLTIEAPDMQAVTLGSAEWTLHPLPLLSARLAAEVVLTDTRGDATGHVELTRKGLLVLRDVSARALFSPDVPSGLPPGWSGRVEVDQLELELQQEQLLHLQGELRFFDLRDDRRRELGNYMVSFPPAEAPPFRGELSDTGGPFELRGALELTDDRRWTVEGTLRPRPGADPALTSYLAFLGAADSSGRYPLSIEGSFR